MPSFWGYPLPPDDYHAIDSYWIPSQNKTKSKLQILENMPKLQIFYFWENTLQVSHFSSCLIRCENMKWIQQVLLKIQTGHDSVHRWKVGWTNGGTDGQNETSISLSTSLKWGYDDVLMPICITQPKWAKHSFDIIPLIALQLFFLKPRVHRVQALALWSWLLAY